MLFYFPRWQSFKLENESLFPTDFALNKIRDLNLQCQDCSSKLHVQRGEKRLLQNSFHFNSEEQPPVLPTELLPFMAMMN
jgi:hypothetical protein